MNQVKPSPRLSSSSSWMLSQFFEHLRTVLIFRHKIKGMKAELRLLAMMTLLLGACAQKVTREPAQQAALNYPPERVRLLRAAAEEGVLFQIPDAVIRDVPSRSIGDRCRTSQEAPWIDQSFEILKSLEQAPRGLSKIHAIELRRGDQPGAEISKDLDGAITLQVFYSKLERREMIQTMADVPCARGDSALIGKEMTVVEYEWPNEQQIQAPLAELGPKSAIERFTFERGFLEWLAERATIFRLNPEVAFEKTPTGQPLLPTIITALSQEIATNPVRPSVDFWLREISVRSRSGAGLKLFGLFKDISLSHGLQVDSVGQFTRKMNGYADPTYPYITYKIENSAYRFASITQLDECLSSLVSTYRSPVAAMTSYEMDPDSFMFPGHHCQSPSEPNQASGAD